MSTLEHAIIMRLWKLYADYSTLCNCYSLVTTLYQFQGFKCSLGIQTQCNVCQWWYYKTRHPFLIYIFFFTFFPAVKSINFSSLLYTFSFCKNLKFCYLSHANQYPFGFPSLVSSPFFNLEDQAAVC